MNTIFALNLIENAVQIASLVIVGLAAFQMGLFVLSSWRRLTHEKKQLKISEEILQAKLDEAKLLQFKQENATLTWNGFRKFVVKRKFHEGKKRKTTPYLVSDDTGKEYEITEDETSVGRLKTANIMVVHGTVSGAHAKIIHKKKELFLEDLLSTNGTRVNGEPLQPQIRIQLNHGDTVHFGELAFKVHIPSSQVLKPQGGDICSFYLAPHDGKPLPSFEPGQYLTFQFKIPDQAKPVIRCYSLSDAPSPEYYRVSIKRDFRKDGTPGLVSGYWHDFVEEGDIIDVKAPGGKFYLDMNKQKPVVLIGGGIGLTPCLSMVNTLLQRNSKLEIWFFYGVRDGAEHIFKKYLDTLALENDNIRLHVCYSRPGPDDVKGRDYQHQERVSVDLFTRLLPSNNYDYYMCGPGPMMNSVVNGLKDWGVPTSDIYFEAFGPATVSTKKKPEAKPAAPGEAVKSFEVTFGKSDKTVNWTPDSGSLLELAEENGVTIDFGCRAGNCGTCLTALKSGDVEGIDGSDPKPEEGTCLTCVSIPKGKLVLDA